MESLKELYKKPALARLGNQREITMFDPGLQFSGIDPAQKGSGGGGGMSGGGGLARLPETGLAAGAFALVGAAFVVVGSIIRKFRKA